jgi:hypothetical protein
MQKSANGWTVLSCSQGYLPREAILGMVGGEVSEGDPGLLVRR